MSALGSGDSSSMDATQLMVLINQVKKELENKLDKDDLQAEMNRLSAQLTNGLDRVSKENKEALNDLRHEIERVA